MKGFILDSSDTISPEQLTTMLEDQDLEFAFLFGNGINNYAFNEDTERRNYANWETIVKNLWDNNVERDFTVDLKKDKGISLTEIYDLINIQEKIYNPSKLKDAVLQYFKNHRLAETTNYHLSLIEALKRWSVPVLTMNFDRNIEYGLEKTIIKDSDIPTKKEFTPYYPWNVVSTQNYTNRYRLLNEFCVWHINGMLDYKSSIRFGLSDYMGAVERARGLIKGLNPKREDEFEGKHQNHWLGSKTWMHPFFNRHLCIVGLTLDTNENFLRWLLIERKNYYLKYDDVHHYGGWYIYPSHENLTEGKMLFLRSVGIEPIKMENYETIYKDFLLKSSSIKQQYITKSLNR